MHLNVKGTQYEVIYPAVVPSGGFKSPLLGLDIETAPKFDHPLAGLDPWMTNISLIQVFDPAEKRIYIFDVLEKGIDERLLHILGDYAFVAHNAKFELTHLLRAGVVFKKPVHCTMLMSQLIGGISEEVDDPDEDELETPVGEKDGIGAYKRTSHSLEACSIRWLSIAPDKQNQKSKWGVRPLTEGQIEYAALDSVLTVLLFRNFAKILEKFSMMEVYNLQRRALFPIVEMETTGIAFDWFAHERLIDVWKVQFDEAEMEARGFFGNLNLGSPKQLGEWLLTTLPEYKNTWPRTAKGALSFTQTSLADFRHLPPIESLFRWKKVQKLLSTYGEDFAKKHRHPITNRVHTSFTLGETATGRLSSRRPNLQNQPRDGTIRSLFVAPFKKVLTVADFSQIELRLQAEISGDPTMLSAYRDGVDIYKVMASTLYGVPINEVTKAQRTLGKVAMLSLGYGTGARKLRSTARAVYDLEIDEEQAFSTHRTYHETFKRYSEWCSEVRHEAEMSGYATTLTGKMRRIPPEKLFTIPPNHIIQGTATELLLHALLSCQEKELKLLLTVHDEILVESDVSEAEEDCEVLSSCMNEAMKKMFPQAASFEVADAKSGENWSKAKS